MRLEDPLDHVVSADQRLGGAVVRGQGEPRVGDVDGDDPFGAGEPAADDGAEADHAGTEDDAGRAPLDLGGVECGPDPGREPAGEQRGAVERSLPVDLRERDLRHDRVLREGRGAHEMPDGLAVAEEARRAVGKEALVLLVTNRQTEVRARAAAVDALAALRREERDDVIAGLDQRDVLTHGLDDSGTLVTEHRRRVAGGVGAGGRVEIGVTDATGNEPDEHLARLGLGEVELLDGQRPAELLEDSGADLHAARRSSRSVIGET